MKYMLAASALLVFGICQTTAQNNQALLRFQEGDTVYVFGENTNLRAEANTSSAVLAQLGAGEKVVILGQSKHTMSLNERTEHWYKVKTMNQPHEGHVWGALLACVSAQIGDVVFAMNKVGTAKPVSTDMIVRAIRDGKILHTRSVSEFPFYISEIGTCRLSSKVEGNRGMSGFQSIIMFSSDMESGMCDVEGSLSHLLLLWDGKSLSPLPLIGGRGYWRFGVYEFEKYIFPADPEGHQGLILHYSETGSADEEAEEVIEYSKKIRVRKLVKRANHFVLPE
jgi:Bacterial SH3 domain